MEDKITLDPKRLIVVDIVSVRPNTYNPKDKDTKEFEDVKNSVKVNGLKGFISVRENPGANPAVDKYEIIDGEQRWRACSELGYKRIIVYNEGKIDDRRAKELTLWWDVYVHKNELSLAKLITSMIQEYGEIITPYSQKQIEEMQELAKFSFDQFKGATVVPPPPSGELLKTLSVQMTSSQYDIVQQALDKAKKAASSPSDSRALEFICAEYLGAPEGTVN